MSEILIFGGTSEGREIAEFCSEKGIKIGISVTTDYGAELLPRNENVKIFIGKLDIFQIKKLITEKNFKLIIDATHPYAVLASENIKAACKDLNKKYFRLIREQNAELSGKIAENISDVIAYLNCSEKHILSTFGSKELPDLRNVANYKKRIWIRVLPVDGITEYCENLGFDKDRIIFGKGPFSFEKNIEHIRKSSAEILVTKESGEAGGYLQKIQAAKECGIEIVTLKRPIENGYTISEIKNILKNGEKK